MKSFPSSRLILGVLVFGVTTVVHAETEIQVQSWPSSAEGFAQFNAELTARDEENLLNFPGAKLLQTEGVAAGQESMIADGTAGVWVGTGRMHLPDGKATRIVYYLGRPRLIREIRVLTSNSDSRTNQDYEIRLARSVANSKSWSNFPAEPTFTSGNKVIGPNQGPCISSIVNAKGSGNISEERYDLIEFLVNPTYRANAGSPARTNLAKRGWCTLVELQVLADPEDPQLFDSPAGRQAWMAEIERRRKEAEAARARAEEEALACPHFLYQGL